MSRLKTAFNRAAKSAPREADLFLMRAIVKDDNRVAFDMIDQGANINYRNQKGETPLMAAAYHGNSLLVDILLKQGSDVNTVDADGNTAMHWLARADWTREIPGVAKLLIDNGADITLRNAFGETAGFIASKLNKDRLARLLQTAPAAAEAIEVVKPIRLKTAAKAEPAAAPVPVTEDPPAPPAPKVEKSETIRDMEKRFAKAGLFG